jgi:Asp-tRNA(Asn)/Glu-tRNA(Gln) amidotransferase A subunit family amidase
METYFNDPLPFPWEVGRFVMPFNLTGHPTISLPAGFSAAGLPIGIQLVGRPFEETVLFRAGAAFQSATDWHTKQPPLWRKDGYAVFSRQPT